MIIRQAQPEDAEAIAALWNPVIRDTAITFNSTQKTVEGLSAEISSRHAFLLAEEGGLMGFASYGQFRGGVGYARTGEHTIILSPGTRGRGIGRLLMQALEDHAREAGFHSMIAGVSGENPGGIAFHERMGYAQVAVLPQVGWKFGRWMDLILLQKLL
ncbi:N-acetyltransferase family protein [Roseovarius sp. A21]|uniref:N-acetyltransferase family protein n=1 Tax=Roseovarius bejariae TaxID=2576383 RepID=A0A844CSQ9_9RHOB|nr:GNAT family N-acetyltransferase [Roseovarius bejariae]MRU14266.1 N-acetyltransferase family protein [Roseovarius bejariae]